MVNFTVEQLREIMDRKHNIRNMSVIAHVDHGKSTLSDSLVAAAGIVSANQAGDLRYTQRYEEEQKRGITIKSTGISLYFRLPEDLSLPAEADGREFIINLIDSPGHVDFSSEVTAALRVTDGGLVVVDCVEGVCVQTETVLRQALTERIVPVLCINKIDRAFTELMLEPEEMYRNFQRVIESANVVIATYQGDTRAAGMGVDDLMVSPENGTVAFGAGVQAWGFTLQRMARIYSAKFGVPADKLVRRFWGDHYYNPETKTWQTTPQTKSGKILQRGFCQFCLGPIKRVFDTCMAIGAGQAVSGAGPMADKLDELLKVIEVSLTPEERAEGSKKLVKHVMRKFLPASEALLEMMVFHLPSPARAQRYRCDILYTGPLDDATARAFKECDANGPLLMYVSKMVPNTDIPGRFFAFGRVFSGTVRTGQKVRIMGPEYVFGEKTDLREKNIQKTVVMMGRYEEAVGSVPCGNTVALVGIDQVIVKTGTLATDPQSYPMRDMKFSVSPVVRVAVEAKTPSDLPKLVEGLKRLAKSENLVQCIVDEATGQHIVAGAGELHLEICLKDLQQQYMGGTEIKVSDPVVTFRETVTMETPAPCLAKSPNKHNRVYCLAAPLAAGLVDEIDKGKITSRDDIKERSRRLVDEYQWDVTDARKIWAFGPNISGGGDGPNVVVDATRGVQYVNESREYLTTGFREFSASGILAGEPLRGVRFTFVDMQLHRDSVHRGAGQLIPAAQRVFASSQLSSRPRFSEPIYFVEVQAPTEAINSVYSVLTRRRGIVVEQQTKDGTPLCVLRAHLPVLESFGFSQELRAATAGRAFPQMVFDHWAVLDSDPLVRGERANDILLSIRKRKGLKLETPTVEQYLDSLHS